MAKKNRKRKANQSRSRKKKAQRRKQTRVRRGAGSPQGDKAQSAREPRPGARAGELPTERARSGRPLKAERSPPADDAKIAPPAEAETPPSERQESAPPAEPRRDSHRAETARAPAAAAETAAPEPAAASAAEPPSPGAAFAPDAARGLKGRYEPAPPPRLAFGKGFLVGALVGLPLLGVAALALAELGMRGFVVDAQAVLATTAAFAGPPFVLTTGGVGRLAARTAARHPDRRARGVAVAARALAVAGPGALLIALIAIGGAPRTFGEWMATLLAGGAAGGLAGAAAGAWVAFGPPARESS